MSLLDSHGRTLAGFDRTVRLVRVDQWDNPTPCTEWTVRDVVNHIVSEQLWVPHLLHGATLAEVGDRYDGDVLGHDPVRAWSEASTNARRAWTEEGATERTVHLSFGASDASLYGWQMTTDLAVHAWDVAVGIEIPQPIEDDVAEELIPIARPVIEAAQGTGILAPPVEVSDTASASDRIVALCGRSPR
ncbi:TIGR03086 family metal-binding protein [Streptomyces scopuliridis]|uniref:TIGR03086 family metal-binding protein n=1 Tax=Streptomyces scopuliridis TaxID=452529 RepID=UPI0036B0FF40